MNRHNTAAADHRAPPAAAEHSDYFNFGCWHFQPDSGDLSDGSSTTRLEPQVARLLEYFLRHQHKVISRDELLASAWQNRIVSDDAISRCVSILRQILSPEDKNAYIETVVRKGYIAHFPPPQEKTTRKASPPRRRQILLLAALACVAVAALYLVAGKVGEPTADVRVAPAGTPLVAVLPFTAIGRGPEGEFFARGVHNDLITRLSQLQSLRVISQTSVMEYAEGTRNLRQIGEELGADVVLEGSVQTADTRIRINAQLIDARSDEHLWAASYDRDLAPANLFRVQGEIARAITAEMNTTLTTQDSAQLALVPTANMAAYKAYHRALQLRDAPGAGVADPGYLEALEEAVELDPGFTRAWAELVSTLAYLNFSGYRPEMTLRAEQALRRLQVFAPGSADHLIGQAAYVYYTLKDYDRARDIISRALAMNPSDVLALELKSLIERRQGDFDAYLNTRREARRLDPRNPATQSLVLRALVVTHRYDEALEEIERAPRERSITALLQNVLRFREHRDLQRLQDSMRESCQYYPEPDCGWETDIANRDYTGALAALAHSTESLNPAALSEHRQRQMMTYWLMGNDPEQQEEKFRLQELIEQEWRSPSDGRWPPTYLDKAMLAGMEGKRAAARQLIERWFRQEPVDWAERSVRRHLACRVLGMIAATRAAVDCIRDGLAEASLVTPFLEPYLSYYDAIRDTPEFIALLDEVAGARAGDAQAGSGAPGETPVAGPDYIRTAREPSASGIVGTVEKSESQ